MSDYLNETGILTVVVTLLQFTRRDAPLGHALAALRKGILFAVIAGAAA